MTRMEGARELHGDEDELQFQGSLIEEVVAVAELHACGDGGTEQRSTADDAGQSASRYLRSDAPPNECPTITGGTPPPSAASGPFTNAEMSATCWLIFTVLSSHGDPDVPRSETAWHAQPNEVAKRSIHRSQHQAP